MQLVRLPIRFVALMLAGFVYSGASADEAAMEAPFAQGSVDTEDLLLQVPFERSDGR